MNLMILVGVWAIAFGHITLTSSLKFKGNDARAFGTALILFAAFALPHVNGWTSGFLPDFAANNEALRSTYGTLICAFMVYATGWVMAQVNPKLRLPSVNVSIKHGKKAA